LLRVCTQSIRELGADRLLSEADLLESQLSEGKQRSQSFEAESKELKMDPEKVRASVKRLANVLRNSYVTKYIPEEGGYPEIST
jgi:regulator of sirC expression with transglutaminase-like and TPR domain